MNKTYQRRHYLKNGAGLIFVVLFWLSCNGGKENRPAVHSVVITPPGDTTATTLTARIEAEGSGTIAVQWFNAVYDTLRIARIDTIEIDSTGTYTSTLASGLGWSWVDIRNENDSLLWHTDSVFCGPDSSLPAVQFTVDQDTGPYPLTVTFSNTTEKNTYTKCLWDFGDGSTSTDWSSVHTYANPGDYQAVLKVYTLAGSASDSVMIHVHEPLSITSVEITPPGSSSQTTLTASIQAEGEGKIRVQWFNAVYDTVHLAVSDEIEVNGNNTYSSIFSSGLGWYWVDIRSENDSLLWHTDSVFCGPDTSLPTVEFYPDWEYGPHPLRITFYNYSRKDDYTRAFFDFRDGATSTEWQPTHTFEEPGQFYVVLKVSNLAGSASDSTLIFVW